MKQKKAVSARLWPGETNIELASEDRTPRSRSSTSSSSISSSPLPRAKKRHRLSEEEKRVRARDAERRRVDRQQRLHAGLMEESIADRSKSPNVVGAAAEERAVVALEADGYFVVKRNWKCDTGELDVVARDGDVLCFVEVRSREDDGHGHAAEMVTFAKRAQVSKVAYLYLTLERPSYDECRFDVVAVTGESIEIIKDAWRLGRA